MQRSIFQHVLIFASAGFGSGIVSKGTTDSSRIEGCQFWNVSGTGIEIGPGAQVEINGGRIIGYNTSGTGIFLTGNAGGIHVIGTDLIKLNICILTKDEYGNGSNRELFLTHATLDSSWRGLSIKDNNIYVSMTGCWVASCIQDNIHIEYGLFSPLIVISGGTIFNGGALGNSSPSSQANGIVVNSGSFILNGVSIRNNLGKGIWVPNNSVTKYSITGCKISYNGQGITLNGNDYIFTGNVLDSNGYFYYAGNGHLVVNNIIR